MTQFVHAVALVNLVQMCVNLQCGFNIRVPELTPRREDVYTRKIKQRCESMPEPVRGDRRDHRRYAMRIVDRCRLFEINFRVCFSVLCEISVFQVKNIPISIPHAVPAAFCEHFAFCRADNKRVFRLRRDAVLFLFECKKINKLLRNVNDTDACFCFCLAVFLDDLPLIISTDLLISIVFA